MVSRAVGLKYGGFLIKLYKPFFLALLLFLTTLAFPWGSELCQGCRIDSSALAGPIYTFPNSQLFQQMISTNGTFLFQDAIDRLPAYSNGVKLEIRTQSKSPLRLAYDVNNYVDFSVGSSGSLTINATGGVVVNGGIKIGNVSDCTADKAGTIRWSGQHFEGCTGTVWRQLDADSTPSIFSIVPAFGPVATIIDITGTNFVPGAQVSIGGVAATNVTYVSAMHITATIPANSTSGAKDVTVTNPDTDVAVKSGGFTYSVYATGGTITSKTISGIVYRIHTFTNTAGSDTLAVTTGGMLRIF